MNNAMNVKPVTSTRKVKPMGRPSDRMRPRAFASGQDQRANTRNRLYPGANQHQPQASAHTTHEISAVATAQPVLPSSGAPRLPYMNTQLSGTLSARPMSVSAITVRGREIAVEKL